MTDSASISLPLVFLVAVLLAGGLAGWLGRRALRRQQRESERLRSLLADKEQWLARTLARCDELQAELGALHDKLGKDETRIEQLRDLVKVHVARRREFDEWAEPIRASLGEAFGYTLRSLKEQLTRQEFALRRQERMVADAEAHYRSKQGELEGMRRELTLKNYHIAALNERFIRVEERMQELMAQVAAIVPAPSARAGAADRAPAAAASVTPETERFTLDKAESRDWMEVLDDWHRQLHDRLDRMDALQAHLRERGARAVGPQSPAPGRPGEAGAV